MGRELPTSVGQHSPRPVGGHTTNMGRAKVKIDWVSVKKQTLWSYEDLIGKL
jgi:hypothetical protein